MFNKKEKNSCYTKIILCLVMLNFDIILFLYTQCMEKKRKEKEKSLFLFSTISNVDKQRKKERE